MVGSSSSKILTVSYGTFSCTLEGFDDPFSTMRHIAEYFRDLAADDRYFGAEPPTPDAEMLHRIAEREIQRRVEARVTGENVVLRQLDTGLAEDEAEETSSSAMGAGAAARGRAWPEPSRDVEPEEPQAAEIGQAETPEPAHAEDLEDEAPLDPRAGSIEEKLSRIRAVVERTRSRELGAGLATAVTEQDDADDEAMVADMSPGFTGDIDAMLISQVMAEQAAGDDRMPEEDAATTAETVWDFDETVAEAEADAETSADERAANDDAGSADTDAGPDIGPGASAGDELTVESDAPEDVSEPVHDEAEDEAVDDGEMPDEPSPAASQKDAAAEENAAEDTDAAIARIMGEDTPVGEEALATADETAPLGADEPELQAEVEPDIVLELDAAEDDGAPNAEQDAPGDVTGTDEGVLAEDGSPHAEAAEAEVVETSAEASAAGDEDEDEDEFWDVDFDAEARAEAAERAREDKDRALDLDADDGADWQADAEADAAPKGATTLAEARAERSLSKSSQLRAPEEESARIVSRTETAFSENEGTRRRSAIAHLKAAVAATRADKILSRVVGWDRAGDPEEQKDYREDLSNIVKPRKTSEILEFATPEQGGAKDDRDEDVASAEPEDETTLDIALDDEERDEAPARRATSRVKTRLLGPEDTVSETAFEQEGAEDGATAETAGDERSSPLMLVSELRVDRDSGAPVRPRRVSRDLKDEAGSEDGKGFAEFVERMGANDLTDLMEAAAAYTAFVEGQPHFSRPQIMRRVANVDPTIEDSREAGLRSFGQLLRQGRIQKLQRGQFTVSQSSRFKPERQIAGE